MHYYTFNVGDYRKDTGHLTTLEHGIYRQLLDWYYLDEKPIPKETQVVIRRLRLGSESDMQSLQNVLNDFFVLQDDGYHQAHCDSVIAKYHGNAEKNKANGKLGGRPKKTQSVILGNPNETQPKGNQEPITNNHKPTYISLRFAEFWSLYPNSKRKGAKGKCEELWAKKGFDDIAEQIFSHVRFMTESDDWTKDNGQYIKAPLAYLNGKPWDGWEETQSNKPFSIFDIAK